MCKSSLIPQAMEMFLWKAVCSETGLYRLGRGQQKRSERNLAGALLHSGQGRRKRTDNSTSSASYMLPKLRRDPGAHSKTVLSHHQTDFQ